MSRCELTIEGIGPAGVFIDIEATPVPEGLRWRGKLTARHHGGGDIDASDLAVFWASLQEWLAGIKEPALRWEVTGSGYRRGMEQSYAEMSEALQAAKDFAAEQTVPLPSPGPPPLPNIPEIPAEYKRLPRGQRRSDQRGTDNG